MTQGLERRYGRGDHYFVTTSCYGRQPFFASPESRLVFERCLEAVRAKYGFRIDSYVVMPEHIHLLVSEPTRGDLSAAMQGLKISVARRMEARPFWQDQVLQLQCLYRREEIRKATIHPSQSVYARSGCAPEGVGRVELSALGLWREGRRRGRVDVDVCRTTGTVGGVGILRTHISKNRDVGHPDCGREGRVCADTTKGSG